MREPSSERCENLASNGFSFGKALGGSFVDSVAQGEIINLYTYRIPVSYMISTLAKSPPVTVTAKCSVEGVRPPLGCGSRV